MKISRIIEYFERVIVYTLLVVTGIIGLISTFDLVVIIIQNTLDITTGQKNIIILDPSKLLSVFSFVLLFVIGLELFEAIKQYLNHHVLQVEIILIVALTAFASKVIIFDYDKYPTPTIVGMAALAIALALSCFLIKKAKQVETSHDH